jgi:hypothetical protein
MPSDRHRRRVCVVAGVVLAAISLPAVRAAAQDLGTIKVTVARANVRAEPNDKAPVVSQVTQGTILILKAIEGDWFKVQLPATGAIRVEAYISRKVSAIDTLAATASAAAKPAGPPGSPAASKTGMTVAWHADSGTTWLESSDARLAQLSERGDSVRAIAAVLPAEFLPPIDAGATQVAYVWAIEAAAVEKVVEEKRPVFIVQYKDVPGVSPDDLAPALVRLTASPAGHRVVAMARGRADEVSRTTPEWDVVRDLRQDVVRSTVQVVERGTARLQPNDDLAPGEYAVVIRPARKRLAGATVLSTTGEGRLFATAWAFTVK